MAISLKMGMAKNNEETIPKNSKKLTGKIMINISSQTVTHMTCKNSAESERESGELF